MPFFKKKIKAIFVFVLFFLRVGGDGPEPGPSPPSSIDPHRPPSLISHHASRSLILQSTLKVHLKDCIFINLFKKINDRGSGWCLHSFIHIGFVVLE